MATKTVARSPTTTRIVLSGTWLASADSKIRARRLSASPVDRRRLRLRVRGHRDVTVSEMRSAWGCPSARIAQVSSATPPGVTVPMDPLLQGAVQVVTGPVRSRLVWDSALRHAWGRHEHDGKSFWSGRTVRDLVPDIPDPRTSAVCPCPRAILVSRVHDRATGSRFVGRLSGAGKLAGKMGGESAGSGAWGWNFASRSGSNPSQLRIHGIRRTGRFLS